MDKNELRAKKISTHYKVSNMNPEFTMKDIDLTKRTVTGMFNTYNFIDSDMDMLLDGAAKKSISHRGPKSEAPNKIKHLKNHNWNDNMARIDVLKEKKVDFNGQEIKGIYHESFYPETTLANDMLINIQEGVYDNRSIGFKYVELIFVEKDGDNWEKYLSLAINPEVAEEAGFLWVVPEIKLWEGSDVTFGANELTPMLGLKDGNKEAVVIKTFERIDLLQKMVKSGTQSDETLHNFAMEVSQLKQILTELFDKEPSLKDTILEDSRNKKDTQEKDDSKKLKDDQKEYYLSLIN